MNEATSTDWRIVTRQLGRSPRAFSHVCRRCRYDYPQVILTEPLHRRGERWEVFPTVYWLTCPLLHRAISRLEAEGQIRHYEERLRTDDEFAARMEQAHREAAADRISLVPEDLRKWLSEERSREARALAETGIAGIRNVDGVKCLHAHYADFVGRGNNPIGADVHRQLLERGVPPGGTDACWKFCSVSGARPFDALQTSPERPASQRRAVIDIGTNSVRLLVADVDASAEKVSLRPVWRGLATPRLGRGVDRTGRLAEDAIIATVEAVDDWLGKLGNTVPRSSTSSGQAVARRRKPGSIHRPDASSHGIVRASAERTGRSGGGVFRCGAGYGARPGRARVRYGVRLGRRRRQHRTGDGHRGRNDARSSQRRRRRRAHDRAMCSFGSDQRRRLGRLVAIVQAKLQPLLSAVAGQTAETPVKLLAVGGTATTLAAMQQQLRQYDRDRVHGYTLTRAQVARIIEALKAAPVAERRAWPGLHPQRADIILAGAVIVHQVMAGLSADELTVSDSDLLEGVLLKGPVVDPRS